MSFEHDCGNGHDGYGHEYGGYMHEDHQQQQNDHHEVYDDDYSYYGWYNYPVYRRQLSQQEKNVWWIIRVILIAPFAIVLIGFALIYLIAFIIAIFSVL